MVEIKEVRGKNLILSSALSRVPRKLAELHKAVPTAECIERAKANFKAFGLDGVCNLIEIIQTLETEEEVVGYFGFTFDREGLTHKPLDEGETDEDRGMKIMRLPHPQWGNARGTATVLGGLVKASDDPGLPFIPPQSDSIFLLNQLFKEAAMFLARGTSTAEA